MPDSETKPIGFYDSHVPTMLGPILVAFRDAEVPFDNADCLCKYSNITQLAPIVVAQPHYEGAKCPEALKRVFQSHPETKFYVPLLTTDIPTIDRIMETIGSGDNITYLCSGYSGKKWQDSEPFVTTILEILKQLKEPALSPR